MSENLLKRIRKRQTTNFKQKNYELLKQLTTYKAYSTDCGKIDPEGLSLVIINNKLVYRK